MIAVQMKGFPLAGLLTNVNLQTLAKLSHNLTKPDIQNLSKPDIVIGKITTNCDVENLSKPDIESAVMLTNVDIESTEMMTNDDIFTQCQDKNDLMFRVFLQSIKKGCTFGAAPCVALAVGQSSAASDFGARRCSSERATLTSCWISSPAFTPISSMRASASREDSSRLSSLPLSCRRVISFLAAATKKPAVDSPSAFVASISSKTSCGIRIDICLDLSLLVFAAMREPICCVCDSVYTKINHIKLLLCDSLCYNLNHTLSTDSKQVRHRNSEARRCDNTDGPLTTSVIISNEVAMSDHNTPISGRDSLTPKKYQYRFLALSRSDAAARPCRVSIEAATEQEAHRALAPLFILSLAARLPAQEAHHA